jgi:hypothetical protein
MNMNFQRPCRLELQYLHREQKDDRTGLPQRSAARRVRLEHLSWVLLSGGIVYLAAHASAIVLLAIAGVAAVLFAPATADCIYAQNNRGQPNG